MYRKGDGGPRNEKKKIRFFTTHLTGRRIRKRERKRKRKRKIPHWVR